MDYDSTVDCIKSCIVSVKGGLPLRSLEADFKSVTGEPLRPQRLGFADLIDLLESIEEIYLSKSDILTVKDRKTEHLSKLIEKQKGQTKFKTLKKPVFSRVAGSRVGSSMKKIQPRVLREQEKKLEALRESRLLSDSASAMTARNLQQFDRQEERVGIGAGIGASARGVNSPFGGSTSSLGTAGSFSQDDKPQGGKPGTGRGRGRGWSSLNSVENPGGLSGNATPRRETSSPDGRSFGSESVCRGGGGAFSSSSLSEATEDREPVLFKFQLIGEHFLTKVASLILGFKVEASDTRLCCSSLDLATCLKRLKQSSSLSDKVILMLGLTDIMKGKDLDAIKPVMVELLEYLRSQTKLIVVVTIPVPPCLKKMPKPLKTLLSYNEWLLTLKFPGMRVIDILPYTQNKEKETYDFLCDSRNINAWNETACWTLVEALFFSGICV